MAALTQANLTENANKSWKNEIGRTSVRLNHQLYYHDTNMERLTGVENKEIMEFVLTEHFEESNFLHYKLKGIRYWQGTLPMTEKVIKTFDDPTTLLWARSIFNADREYIENHPIGIWNMLKHQEQPESMPES